MTKTKFTPGPWYRNIGPASKYPSIWAGRSTHVGYVATKGLSEDVIEANLRLMTAAPELLEAVIRLMPAAEDDEFQYGGDPNSDGDILYARAAIAKAIGKTGA